MLTLTTLRPGASGLAASLAAELAVSVLAHPLGPAAPAGSEGVLGTLPHTIRGSLHNWGQVSQSHLFTFRQLILFYSWHNTKV